MSSVFCAAFPMCQCITPCIHIHEPESGDVIRAIDDATGSAGSEIRSASHLLPRNASTNTIERNGNDVAAISEHTCVRCRQRLARFVYGYIGRGYGIKWLETCSDCDSDQN